MIVWWSLFGAWVLHTARYTVPISFADSRFYRVFSSFVDRFLRSFFDRLVIFLCEWGLHTARYNCGQKLTGQNAATLGALASESFTSEAHFWCVF